MQKFSCASCGNLKAHDPSAFRAWLSILRIVPLRQRRNASQIQLLIAGIAAIDFFSVFTICIIPVVFIPCCPEPARKSPPPSLTGFCRHARIRTVNIDPADVAELADAPDLGSGAARHGGSNPLVRTRRMQKSPGKPGFFYCAEPSASVVTSAVKRTRNSPRGTQARACRPPAHRRWRGLSSRS